jgi:hypothetical protein
MALVSPSHSVTSHVHHNNNQCTERNNIEPRNWRPGTGNKPLCSHCRDLNTARK